MRYILWFILFASVISLSGCSDNITGQAQNGVADCSEMIDRFDALFDNPVNPDKDYVVAVAKLEDYSEWWASMSRGRSGWAAIVTLKGNDKTIQKGGWASEYNMTQASIGDYYKVSFNLTKGRYISKSYSEDIVAEGSILQDSIVKIEKIDCK